MSSRSSTVPCSGDSALLAWLSALLNALLAGYGAGEVPAETALPGATGGIMISVIITSYCY